MRKELPIAANCLHLGLRALLREFAVLFSAIILIERQMVLIKIATYLFLNGWFVA